MPKNLLKSIPCVCCGFEIKELKSDSDPLDETMVNDGIINKNVAGYGSKHDENIYLVGICDKCIEKKHKNKTIVLIKKEYKRDL